jgi:hypothetical protein
MKQTENLELTIFDGNADAGQAMLDLSDNMQKIDAAIGNIAAILSTIVEGV